MTLPAIDISELLDIKMFTVDQLNSITRSVVAMATQEVYKKINEKVNSKLKSTRQTYQNGLATYTDLTGFLGTVELIGYLPLMIENGASPFDMKESFEKSSKRHYYSSLKDKKTHWYLTIPFRWGVPTSIGENFSNIQEDPINKIAKLLKPSIAKDNKMEYGGRITMEQLKKINNYQAHTGTSAGWGGHEPYEHKSPIAQGMLKVQKEYEKATQNTYVTFRRVSDKSHIDSWIHPGFKAAKFMDDALKEVDIEKLMQPMIETAIAMTEL